MNDESMSPMTPLDTMVSQDSIQVLKAALPYLSGPSQQILSIYAKTAELSNTISYFQNPQPELTMMSSHAQAVQPAEMLNDIRQYTSGSMRNSIDQLLFALNTIQLIQMYQETPAPQENQENP